MEELCWEVVEIDGHNINQILESLKIDSSKPLAIIANTIKGKGLKKQKITIAGITQF